MENKIQMNIPYKILKNRIEDVIKNKINPEIYFNSSALDKFNPEDAKYLSECLNNEGLSITLHAPFMDLSPGAVDWKIKKVTLERLNEVLEVAKYFKPKVIVCHPGYDKWKFDGNEDRWIKNSIETWIPILKTASEIGTTIALENVFEETPYTLYKLFNVIDTKNLMFCFDTGHCHLFSNVSYKHWLEELGDRTIEIHIHDNNKKKDEHLPIGYGTINFLEIFNNVSNFVRNPIYTIEPHREEHIFPSFEGLKKYITRS